MSRLPAMDVRTRLTRLRAAIDRAELDCLLVTHLPNIRYLSGFSGSAALLAVTGDAAVLVTDGRYAEQAPAEIESVGADISVVVSGDRQREEIRAVLSDRGRIGLEGEHVAHAAWLRYCDEWFPGADVRSTSGVIETLREVKDAGEIARIRAACSIADAALAEVRSGLADGPTEAEFGLELDTAMRRRGSPEVSFETIVASGPNAAKPHARPTDRRIVEGDLVVIDFGAMVDGYHSDMTRTVMIGTPSPTQQRMLEVVGEAQSAGVAAVAAGVAAAAVDAACRDVIDKAGWAAAFLHGTGHGVGLDIHEAPRVGARADATLAAGQVVTVEPGVYLPEHGGVRIEDTVVVCDTGAEPLTLAPKLTSVT